MKYGRLLNGGDLFGALLVCRTPKEECPRFDKELEEAIGEVIGDPIFIRKLK